MSDEAPPSLPPPPFWRTVYFHDHVRKRRDRIGITDADILGILDSPIRRRQQSNGRWRLWGRNQADTHRLSVILLEDAETVHTVHLDRNFRP